MSDLAIFVKTSLQRKKNLQAERKKDRKRVRKKER